MFVLALLAACARPGGSLDIRLNPDHASGRAVVEIRGLSSGEVSALESAGWTGAGGSPVIQVRVAGTEAAMPSLAGTLSSASGVVVFTPMFPFDAGRAYVVEVDTTRLSPARAGGVVSATVSLPAVERVPSTRVARIMPTAEVWPENTLRFYVEFSKPMATRGGLAYVKLLDEAGEEVVDPFLPLDAEFWNPDGTRYTFFFDPGRVKRDILPNREMGRALVAGRTYTIEIAQAWPDAEGLPLVAPYRHAFRVGPPDETPVDPAAWSIDTPAAGTRHPVVVRFPDPLDHGLLSRAVGLATADGTLVTGEVTIGEGERTWSLTPRDPWTAGDYDVVVLSILEDVAGNRVGQRFEVDEFERVDASAGPERVKRRIAVRAGAVVVSR